MADNLISGDDGTAPDYYLVIDFEATCCDKGTIPPEDAEIIEIGAVIADGKRLRPVDEFVRFVRPSRNPQLTAFCSELTSIHQADIDGARTLAEVLPEFSDWVSGYERYLFCSWGDFDHHHLQLECRQLKVPYPLSTGHLNLKRGFAETQGFNRRFGMARALRVAGLQLLGTHHRGIEDARNIVRLLPYIVGGERVGSRG